MDFEQKILQFIDKHKLIKPRTLVIAGVSGGADSMALLLALAGLRHHLGIGLHAAHFNHQARASALKDELFVVEECRRSNIPLTIQRRRGKIKQFSEEDARAMRFGFFVQLADKLKARSVALAHTRNDLAETVLMRVMRGSGLYGLRAILPSRDIEDVNFIRPLIDISRSEVEDYLRTKKTGFCTDPTNQQTLYERNKVRLKLLPLLAKEYNPKIVHALSDLAVTSAQDYDFLSIEAKKQFDQRVIISFQKFQLKLKNIERLHPAILRLVLRFMVEKITQEPSTLSFEHIQVLEGLVSGPKDGRVDLPYHLKAVRTQQFLEIHHA